MIMVQEELTPEERLLKAVQGGPSPLERLRALLSPGERRQALRRFLGGQPIRRTNQALILLIAGLGTYLVVDVALAPQRLKRAIEEAPVRPGALELEGAEAPAAPLEEYLSAIQRRDVFRPPGERAATAAAPQAPASPTEGLRLVGIAWSDRPEALIDDARVQQTIFLKKGQRIRNFTVEQIGPDSVTLRGEDGAVVELR